MAKQRVFLDTNVIIEAFRTRCWSAICGRFAVETVASVEAEGLDLGERDLLAWLLARGPNLDGLLLLSTADKAAIVVTGRLQWLDHLACLASLAQEAGITRHQIDQFRDHFKVKWLDAIQMKVRLGVIP